MGGSSTPEGQQPKMTGCHQWSGEPEAGRGRSCRKSEAIGDLELEGRQRIGEWANVRRNVFNKRLKTAHRISPLSARFFRELSKSQHPSMTSKSTKYIVFVVLAPPINPLRNFSDIFWKSQS